MIKVGVIAAVRAMRAGLRKILEDTPGLQVVFDAPELHLPLEDDIDVLLSVSPSSLERVVADIALLVLTDEQADVRALIDLQLPAWGVLPVDASEDEIAAAVAALAEGLVVCAPTLMAGIFPGPRAAEFSTDLSQPQTLTSRELEILQLTAQGLANKQIAIALSISEHTVKFHLSSLYAKLGVTSRTEAVRAGSRLGWVFF